MENTSHSNFKSSAAKKYLIFFSPLINTCSLDLNSLQTTDKKFLADLHILPEGNDFLIRVKYKDAKSFILKQKNFPLFLKNLALSTKNNSQVDSPSIVKTKKKQLSSTTRDLSSLFEESKKISKFCQSLLKSLFFKDYKSIHLFIHKKGSAFARHLHVTSDDTRETTESIIDFSTLFQSVRKSKNRSFGQSTLKASNFKIIGTCIGQEYSLLNHNLVFIFSNDDFLPQTEKAVESFNTINNYLKVYFELLLNTEFNDHQTDLIKSTIMTLLNLSGSGEKTFSKIEHFDENNYVNFDEIIKQLKERFFDHADINLVERITLLGELLNTLQHELSNPLFGLQLSTAILLQEDLDPEQKMFIENINKSILRSQSILKNFSGLYKKKVKKEQSNLYELINEVIILTKSESRNVKKEIQLHGISKEDCRVQTNQTWFAQIIFNLVINSSQAMRNDNVSTPHILIDLVLKNKFYVLSISDNGPGIPKDAQKVIFDPFYTTKNDGNGLGLAISKKLAVKLGGDLEYKDQEKGACFILRIPK